MISEHYEALQSRIEAGEGLSGKVHDTVRLDATGGLIRDQYVILYNPVPLDFTVDRYTGLPSYEGTTDWECDFRVVGNSPSRVRATLARVLAQLVGHRLVVAGRQPALLTVAAGSRIREDQSVKNFLYFADGSVEWTSRKG